MKIWRRFQGQWIMFCPWCKHGWRAAEVEKVFLDEVDEPQEASQ